MRNIRMLSAVVACAVLASGVGSAVASPVGFHLASTDPVPGYDPVAQTDGTILYVAPDTAFTGDDVMSAAVTRVQQRGPAVKLTLSRPLADVLPVDTRVAVFVKGKFVSAADLHMDATTGAALLTGLPPDEAQRLSHTLGAAPTVPSGPTITAVPAGEADGLILVDVFVSGVADLRGYQVTLAADDGQGGQLELVDIAVDSRRADYVFGDAQALTAVDRTGGRLAGALYTGSVNATRPAYVGTYLYRPLPGARGTFQVNVRTGHHSMLVDDAAKMITYEAGPTVAMSLGAVSSGADRR